MSIARAIIPSLLALWAALGHVSAASAQECAEGRVSTPETLGRCCWPGQSFSETLGRCSGPPRCPPPFVAEGDACVVPYTAGYGVPPAGWPTAPRAATGASRARGTASAAPAAPGEPVELHWPDEPISLQRAMIAPRLQRGIDDGLVAAGLSVLLGGYLGGLVVGGIDEAAANCQSFDSSFRFDPSVGCGSWPYAFIPIAGSVLATSAIETQGACCRNASLLVLGIPMTLVQLFGLTLTAIGLFGGTEELVPSETGGAPTVSVMPYATPEGAGTWLRVEL